MNQDDHDTLVQLVSEVKKLDEKIDALTRNHEKYKGFIAGIIFVVSGLWGLFVAVKDRVFSISTGG